MIRVLEQTHGILDDDLVFKANEFGNLFSNPRFYDLQIYFFHVYLREGKMISTSLVCKVADDILFCRSPEGT